VVTSWQVNSGVPLTVVNSLRVLRPTGAPNTFTTVGDSVARSVQPGMNSFPARIPVQAGDRFGTHGQGPPLGASLYCASENPADLMGALLGDAPLGSTNAFPALSEGLLVAVSATVEPDADGDGFGDETQDACPQSAALQSACPIVLLDSFALSGRGKAVVVVTTSTTAAVTVSGSATLPGGGARSFARPRLPRVTKVVPAGSLTRFVLRFPKRLRSAVAGLGKGRSLTLTLSATAPNLSGPASADTARLKLRGSRR
jgi:hypothetical protein